MNRLQKVNVILKGGKGSGNFGHVGRAGKRGGSGGGGIRMSKKVSTSKSLMSDPIHVENMIIGSENVGRQYFGDGLSYARPERDIISATNLSEDIKRQSDEAGMSVNKMLPTYSPHDEFSYPIVYDSATGKSSNMSEYNAETAWHMKGTDVVDFYKKPENKGKFVAIVGVDSNIIVLDPKSKMPKLKKERTSTTKVDRNTKTNTDIPDVGMDRASIHVAAGNTKRTERLMQEAQNAIFNGADVSDKKVAGFQKFIGNIKLEKAEPQKLIDHLENALKLIIDNRGVADRSKRKGKYTF